MDVLDNSSDVSIECRKFNLDISYVRDVHINGILFVGCKSSFYRIEQIQITNCRFSFSRNIALKLVNSFVYITKSSFSYNYNGIWAMESAVSIHLSKFTHNSKSAIEMKRSNVTSTEISVYHNSRIIYGYMSKFIDKQSNFSNNSAKYYRLIDCFRCSVNFSNSVISYNDGEIKIYSHQDSSWGKISMVQSVIINNHGSITLKFCFRVDIISSKLIDNSASGHAILSIYSVYELYITESTFIDNLVYGGGGAVMDLSTVRVSIKGSVFSNNVARQGDMME